MNTYEGHKWGFSFICTDWTWILTDLLSINGFSQIWQETGRSLRQVNRTCFFRLSSVFITFWHKSQANSDWFFRCRTAKSHTFSRFNKYTVSLKGKWNHRFWQTWSYNFVKKRIVKKLLNPHLKCDSKRNTEFPNYFDHPRRALEWSTYLAVCWMEFTRLKGKKLGPKFHPGRGGFFGRWIFLKS